ncbi:MAG TPA: hypothetical protein VLW50_09820 [Streptosporangiaceae bacterium]|nr:hypothetical protein [Streptosporangiaceae bacterium]
MTGEATVDAYGDDEQAMGFHAMIVDNLSPAHRYGAARTTSTSTTVAGRRAR